MANFFRVPQVLLIKLSKTLNNRVKISAMGDSKCILPWNHVATRTDGSVRPCCISSFSGHYEAASASLSSPEARASIYESPLEQILSSDSMKALREKMSRGEEPAECKVCYNAERRGVVSKRQLENTRWSGREDQLYLDLRLGSVCNLQCVMCSGEESSKWAADTAAFEAEAEHPALKEYFRSKGERARKSGGSRPNASQFAFFLEQLAMRLSQVSEIYFAGGEPLLQEEHDRCLEFLIDSGRSRAIDLCYNTNGTALQESHFRKWERFRSVQVNFSLDAAHARNEYIRFPSKWSKIESRLRLLDASGENVRARITTTVSALNAFHLGELMSWKAAQGYRKIQSELASGDVDLNLLHFPSFLNVQALPHAFKMRISGRLGELSKESWISDSVRARLSGLRKFIFERDLPPAPELLPYLRLLDQKRGTDSRRLFPELYEALES